MQDTKEYPDNYGVNWACGMNFGSAHIGGFACLLCDGTVRFVSYSVNPTLRHKLCARNDNQEVDLSNL